MKNQVRKIKFEKSSLNNQVWRTGFITCKNQFRNWFFAGYTFWILLNFCFIFLSNYYFSPIALLDFGIKLLISLPILHWKIESLFVCWILGTDIQHRLNFLFKLASSFAFTFAIAFTAERRSARATASASSSTKTRTITSA